MNDRSNWIPHHREEDAELLGYLVPVSDSIGMFHPVTIFGYPLGTPNNPNNARQVLDDVGLSYSAERWYLTLVGRDEPIAVTIAEVSPNHVTVRNADYGHEGNIGDPFVLTGSEADRLSRFE
ncbi:hypothetical protein [Paeniglutamicibacter antarcticus]|uniref:Uncharacterized protein n=1 Tax=Paeniglutamicibacter antarcticus TaxID=494023 RepID=A0ABP9TQ20_9MICC